MFEAARQLLCHLVSYALYGHCLVRSGVFLNTKKITSCAGTTSLPTTQKLRSIADGQSEILFISLLVQVLAASDLLSALELQCIVCTWYLLAQNSEEFSIAQSLRFGTVAISRPFAHCVHAIAHIASSMECVYIVFRMLSLTHLCTPPHATFDDSVFSFLCQSLSRSISGSQQVLSHKDEALRIMRLVANRPSPALVLLWNEIISPIARLQKFDEKWSVWTEVGFSATAKAAKAPAASGPKLKVALFCKCQA